GAPLPSVALSAAPSRRWWRSRTLTVSLALLLAAVVAAGLTRRRVVSRGAQTPPMESLWATQGTTPPGPDAVPALSPDGRSIAYASDRSGAFEIAIKSIAAAAREIALTADGQQNVEPAWSPDGQSIAYHSMVRGGIWIVPALGGVPRRAADFGS